MNYGDVNAAKETISRSLAISDTPDVLGLAATVLAPIDPARSSAPLDRTVKALPENFYVANVVVPWVHGLESVTNDPTHTVAAFETIRPYELGTGPRSVAFDITFNR
jgi:hypothetical protein